MNEYTKVRKFPKDCPKECKYLRSWDLSIDDWTNVCIKLKKQVDDCDWDSPFCPFCPLTVEELKEACEKRKKEIGKEDTYGD